jgi:hypothetical protein
MHSVFPLRNVTPSNTSGPARGSTDPYDRPSPQSDLEPTVSRDGFFWLLENQPGMVAIATAT